MDVITKLIELTESDQLHWISSITHSGIQWGTKNNGVVCVLKQVDDPDCKLPILYSLFIGGVVYGRNIDRLTELAEAILKESDRYDQKQLQTQINKFFNDNF